MTPAPADEVVVNPINPTPQHFQVKPASRCSNCGDVLPLGQPAHRTLCGPCCYPAVRKLRRRTPRQVRR